MKKIYKISMGNAYILWSSILKENEIKDYLSIDSVIFPHQMHSNLIFWAEDINDLNCDGIFTKEKKIFVGVKTADCVPLIVYNDNFIGAIHCGWRGLSEGILENMKKIIEKEKAMISECKFFLGPSIGKCCYEVKEDVGGFFPEFFHRGKLDLKGFIHSFLIKNQVKKENIIIDNNCTFCNKSLPSFRRNKALGRILTGIWAI